MKRYPPADIDTVGRTSKMGAFLVLTCITCVVACTTRRAGNSSFEMLPAPRPLAPSPGTGPKATTGESDIRIVHVAARPRRTLPVPKYPPEALTARAGRFTAYITLTINEDGRVTDVQPSLARFALPNDYAAAFLQSIDEALATWDFDPARYVYWQRIANGDERYLRADAVPQRMEVRFTFTESGVVE